VDEGIVDDLVRRWASISDEEALELASAYWAGEIHHSISYLLSGQVEILRRCTEPVFQ